MDEAQKYSARCQEPEWKGHILCDSIYMAFSKGQNYKISNQIRGFQGLVNQRR